MYKYSVCVEFEDVDSYGIAHHTKILAYLERARVHFFVDKGVDLESFPYGLVIRNINMQFKLPLLMLDKVDIEVRVKSIDKLMFEWEYRVLKEEKLAVYAVIEQVVISTKDKRLVEIPETIRLLLEEIVKK